MMEAVFLEMQDYRKRGNEQKLEHGKFWLDNGKKFHHVGGQTLVAQRLCGIPVFGDIQNSTGQAQMASGSPFELTVFLWSYDFYELMETNPVKALQTFPFNKAKNMKKENLIYFLFKDSSSVSQVLWVSAVWMEESDLFTASEIAALGRNTEHDKENEKDRRIWKIKYKQNEHKNI